MKLELGTNIEGDVRYKYTWTNTIRLSVRDLFGFDFLSATRDGFVPVLKPIGKNRLQLE